MTAVAAAALSLVLALSLQEPRTPEETVASFSLPEGFSATVFAGEPALRQPIGFCIDDRGRLWILEGSSYPAWRDGVPERDRIWIFEDTDADGRHDSRKLFVDGLIGSTGIETGFGGVWVVGSPRLLFFPDRDGDDRPDGPSEVLLDGFGAQGGHNIVNGFTWGPDGWLYGGHGRTSISDVGPPGTPPERRVHFDGGVWRFHPVRRVFEPFTDGTTNPWGVAFDERGQMFVSNCVNAHLFHQIQGAHYEPWRERPSSRHAYRRIDTIADHLHYGAGSKNEGPGGGHAHSGALVYLGDSWPERYRGAVFMSNLHGHRINSDLPRRNGSGFTASHGPDLLVSRDQMFLGLLLQTGPDGSVFVSDWYDRGECHTREPHRGSGRIYKIAYGTPAPARVDLPRLADLDLVKLIPHRNDWHASRARRLLQERAASGLRPGVHDALRALFRDPPHPAARLRALWTLHATGGLDAEARAALLDHPDEDVRAWTIQFELEDRELDEPAAMKLARLAVADPSPVVRLYLAAGIRRLPPARRVDVLRGLVAHEEDAADPNLPLVVWYAAEELAETDLPSALGLLRRARLPLFREFMARRIASLGTDRPVVNVVTLGARGDGATDDSAAFQAAIDRVAPTGGRVLIPWGVRAYRIGRPLTVFSDQVEFWGPGARLQFVDGARLAVSGAEGRAVRRLSMRGLRLEGAGEGPVLRLDRVEDAVLEDVQVKGGTSIAGARGLSVERCRFDVLDLSMAESGAPSAEFRRSTVDRTFRLSGDRSAVRLEGCAFPTK